MTRCSLRTLSAFLPVLVLAWNAAVAGAQTITFSALLAEMTSPEALARYPDPPYRSLQASSYNRESTHREAPGWFADSDGAGFIREEKTGEQTEYVLMEHTGPGCLTRIWTPYFYYDLNNHTGPNIRIYLDGSRAPSIDEPLIALVMGTGSVKPPLASPTARAGDLYLPIPFGAGCKVTMTGRPFYYIINYRGYAPETEVETFSKAGMGEFMGDVELAARAMVKTAPAGTGAPAEITQARATIAAGKDLTLALPPGGGAVRELVVQIPSALATLALLRSTVLAITFDGHETVWCPVGDFFCSADSIHPFTTLRRTVSGDGTLVCRWVMPYRGAASAKLINFGTEAVEASLSAATAPWQWDGRSMHFHADWRADDVVPGTPFQDWNFIDINGRGVYVGDAWTVLNPQKNTWWGEGDEKIYVDGAWEAGFPTHFGTGTEDYYGWAGGEIPTRRDEFSHPFLANVRVGGVDGTTQGYNIVTRERGLDAIPFTSRLRFDMESSFGTDIRGPENQLGYSSVVFWYGIPGASDNRPGVATEAGKRIMHLREEAGRTLIER